MQKNVAGQKWIVFAFGRTSNSPVTGDALNITANLRLDCGAANPVDDTNPHELSGGYYYFNLADVETNADMIVIIPVSATPDVIVIGVPGAVWTEPTGRKYPATLTPADCSGNLPAEVKAQDNIDFGVLQKLSLNAATPASVQDITQGATALELAAAVGDLAREDNVQGHLADALTAYGPTTRTEATADKEAILSAVGQAGSGTGAITWTYTLTRSDNDLPIADAEVWITTDVTGQNVIASGRTNQNGMVTFYLDAGTVYVWRQKSGFTFTNPDTEVVS